jgi:predicted exporter
MKQLNSIKWLASSFALTTLGLLVWVGFNFTHISHQIDNDLMSLLPRSERDLNSEKVISRIAKNGENALVLLIGSENLEESLKAEKLLQDSFSTLDLKRVNSNLDLGAIANFYLPYQGSLLTEGDAHQLESNSGKFWYDKSLALAYSFSGIPFSWKDDPFGLLSDWLGSLAKTKVRPYGSSLIIEDSGSTYVVMPLELINPDLGMGQRNALASSIIRAIEKTERELSSVKIQKAGVLFYASDTAIKAESEITIIGIISTLAALALITLAFRSFIAIGAVFLTVCIAFLYALLICVFIYPKVYLLTLAFGTSLIGMSVDYCLYWLTGSIDDTKSPDERRRYLLPGMALALLTTVLGYALLSATPFPVLSQMAVFSISGLIAAWLCVVLFFPMLNQVQFKKNSFYRAFGVIKPGFGISNLFSRYAITALIISLGIYGAITFKGTDNIRALASYDAKLVTEQVAISKLMELPSPAQFFIVSGNTPDEVLTSTEGLTQKLQPLVQARQISSYQAISSYVPSLEIQKKNSESYARLANEKVLQKIAKAMDMPDSWSKSQDSSSAALTFEEFQKSPIFNQLQGLWFEEDGKYFTAVLLSGISNQSTIDQLSKMGGDSIAWINKPEEISEIFKRYRTLFSILIGIGYIITFVGIWIRYKAEAWRAIAPPVLATFITIAILSTLGEPIGLLSILAFALLLGVGTDYGIFLLQYPADDRVTFSITMGALMSLVSFGTLSISHVPALHSFGIALLFGISLSWALTIFFSKKA